MSLLRFCILLSAVVVSDSALAISNVWQSQFIQGEKIYYISNNNLTLTITCNSGGNGLPGKPYDHSIMLEKRNNKGKTEDLFSKPNHALAFLITGQAFEFKTSASGHVVTDYQSVANYWDDFITALQQGRKIELYYDDKKIGEFKPKNVGAEPTKYMSEACESLLNTDWYQDWLQGNF